MTPFMSTQRKRALVGLVFATFILLTVSSVQAIVAPLPIVPTPTPDTGDYFKPGDDRVNQSTRDRGASAAIYCRFEGFHIYAIDDHSQGRLVMVVSKAEVDAVGIPAQNTLIKAVQLPLGELSLWRLSSGEYFLVSPGVRPGADTYTKVFKDCAPQ